MDSLDRSEDGRDDWHNLSRLQKLNVTTPNLSVILVLTDVIQSKFIRHSDIISLRVSNIIQSKNSTSCKLGSFFF